MFEPIDNETFERDPYANQSIQMNRPQKTGNRPEDRAFGQRAMTLEAKKGSELDTPEMVDRHKILLGHYISEMDRQADNRGEMAKDEDLYDNKQWDEIDAALLRSRGQVPLSFNVTATAINWLLGTERRGRTDYRVLPRRKDGAKASERKTDLLKYLSDVNRSEFQWSIAFAESAKAGLSFMESGVQGETDGEPIYDRHESWRNIVWDSASRELDMTDARYMFRPLWTDLDIAEAMFPERKRQLWRAASAGLDHAFFLDDLGDEPMDAREHDIQRAGGGAWSLRVQEGFGVRRRVRLIEAWYQVPVTEKRMDGGQFRGELFDPDSRGHIAEINSGRATIREAVTFRIHVMILCDGGVLWASKSPYRHNRYPFTPIWCYRDSRTGLPYGVIRGMRDIQHDINKRASKALHILNTSKIIADDDAVDDWEELEEEAARPDAIHRVKKGARFEIHDQRALADAQMEIMSRNIQMIQQITGITDESLGRTTNAVSGKAIIARQEQGSLATAPIFDNLRLARQVHGEKVVSLCEQYMTQATEFRIVNPHGNATHISINTLNAIDEQTGQAVDDDITAWKADFVISEDDWNSTIRQTQADQFMELLQNLAPASPEIVIKLLDLAVDLMDTPKKDEVVNRIREINGQKDPDADPNAPPTDEEIAKAQVMQKQVEYAMRREDAEIAKIEADAEQKRAQSQRSTVEALRILTDIEASEVDKQQAAFTLAALAIQSPSAAPVADQIMASAKMSAAELAARAAEATSQPQAPQQPMPAPMPQPVAAPM